MMDTSLEGLYPHVYKRPLRRVNSTLDLVRPKHTITVQLSYNATAALLGLLSIRNVCNRPSN